MLKDILQVALTALCSIVALWLLTRLMGHKQVSQMTMFDYVNGITIGSIAAEMASELEDPVRPLTAMVVYAAAELLISLWTRHSLKARKVFAGKPLVLLDGDVLYRENLKRAKLDLSEFLTYARIAGYFDLNQVQTAVFENNGQISFQPKSTDRPATPADLSLQPRQELLQLPIVLDGQVLPRNLQQVGRDEIWLRRELSKQGYKDPKEVFLAMTDNGTQLTAFPISTNKKPRQPQ